MKSLSLVWLLLLLLLVQDAAATVLLEASFDLALQQESATGYTAANAVGEYLGDPHLQWLRYFHTLASGQPHSGAGSMRVAWMQFEDASAWAAFEEANLQRTHVLYDLFWVNSRRVLWQESPMTTTAAGGSGARKPREGKKGGYVWTFRYAVRPGAEPQHQAWVYASFPRLKALLGESAGFVQVHAYDAGWFQAEQQHMVAAEFDDLASLTESVLLREEVHAVLKAQAGHLHTWATTLLVPSTDAQGAVVFYGAGSGDKGATAADDQQEEEEQQ